jgi:methionyl aminopeptidase
VTVSSKSDLAGLERVGALVALALREMERETRPGLSTAQLDAIGAAFLRRHGARSAPQLSYDFPGFTCISVNEQIVHGVPGPRILAPGDVVKIDVTAELDGFVADAAITVTLPPVTAEARRLRKCAQRAFAQAMTVARPGTPIREIGRVVEEEVKRHDFAVVREMCGHGVGRSIHETPSVPNYYSMLTRGMLTEGMVLAVEPIISARPARVVEEPDGWTLRTDNGSLAAHYEHTVVIRDGEPLLVTRLPAA